MSTNYHRLEPPITAIEIEHDLDGYDEQSRLTIWINGEEAGSLTMLDNDLQDLLMGPFSGDHYASGRPAARRAGGRLTLRPDVHGTYVQLLSDYGVLTTVQELVAEAGEQDLTVRMGSL